MPCQYIELSPSGNGLRGFGYGDPMKGTRGLIDGNRAELYTGGRYLTVTGHTIRPGPLVQLPGFMEVASAIRGDDLQKRQRKQNQSSVSSVSSVSDLPTSTVPTQPGMRNRCLFELVRFLKGT
jgi:primase-polymerase (primpol)-like protein